MAGVAREPFSGSGNLTKRFATSYESLFLVNNGGSPLTFSTPSFTFTLDAGDVFDEQLDPFDTLTVTATGAFRGYAREGA